MIKNISILKNKELGKDIYILANAPSIKEEELSLLKDKVSIGMNANPLLEKEGTSRGVSIVTPSG